MNWIIKFIFIFFLVVNNSFSLTVEEEKKYDEFEGAEYLAALYKDKKYNEILKYYPKLNKSEQKEVSALEAYGISLYEFGEYSRAVDILQKIENQTKLDSSYFYLTLTKASSNQQKFTECFNFFKEINPYRLTKEDWSLGVSCLEKSNIALNEKIDFYLTVRGAIVDYLPSVMDALYKHQLHLEVEDLLSTFKKECRPITDIVIVSEVIEKNKQSPLDFLEYARLCYPSSLEIVSIIVRKYHDLGLYHSIARLFENLSIEDTSFYRHTAEFYRLSGRDVLGEYFLNFTTDDNYVLAKASKYINEESYAKLLNFPVPLNELNKNAELSYALAFAQFKFNTADTALMTLAKVIKPNDRVEMLKALSKKCLELSWRCKP